MAKHPSIPASMTAQDALAAVMVAVSASDQNMTTTELLTTTRLVDFLPIATGIENTNYFVTTEGGRFVLTLYERLPAEDLPFYLNFMAHLARAGCAVIDNRRRASPFPSRNERQGGVWPVR